MKQRCTDNSVAIIGGHRSVQTFDHGVRLASPVLINYKLELTDSLTQALEVSTNSDQESPKAPQKLYYDHHAKTPRFCVRDCVFVYMPSAKKGKARKFARPFHGPFHVIELTVNDVKVCLSTIELILEHNFWIDNFETRSLP